MHILLDEVLRAGCWGPLRLPATRAMVRSALGAPDDWMGPAPSSSSAVWRYGVVEAHFFDDDCWMLWCDDLDEIESPSRAFAVNAWLLRACMGKTREAAKAVLAAAGIDSRRLQRHPGEQLLVTAPGTALVFQPHLTALILGAPDFHRHLF